jgi:hypothetical protein
MWLCAQIVQTVVVLHSHSSPAMCFECGECLRSNNSNLYNKGILETRTDAKHSFMFRGLVFTTICRFLLSKFLYLSPTPPSWHASYLQHTKCMKALKKKPFVAGYIDRLFANHHAKNSQLKRLFTLAHEVCRQTGTLWTCIMIYAKNI